MSAALGRSSGNPRGRRIVLLANNIDELGGAQRVVHLLAQGFGDRGHDVTLVGIVPHATGFPHEALLPADLAPSYRTQRLAPAPMPAPVRASRARRLADPRIRRAIRARAAAEAVVVKRLQHLLDAGPRGIAITAQVWSMEFLARCDLGDPACDDHWRVVGQYHSSFEAAARGRDLDRARAVYRDVDALLALTEHDAEQLTAAGFANATWIENPLRLDDSAGAVESTKRRRTFAYLGRFSGEKAPLTLLRAWRQAHEQAPEVMDGWTLELTGSGPQEQHLRDAAAGRTDIRVHGPTTDPASVLARAGVVVLPSLDEGFPLVLAEAMATGAACVASDCSAGVRALVDDGHNGLLAERGNPVHLAEQLIRLAADDGLRERLGGAARASVERLHIDRVLDQWGGLFEDVMR